MVPTTPAPYYRASKLARADEEPEAPRPKRKPLPRLEYDEATLEQARRLAAGVFT